MKTSLSSIQGFQDEVYEDFNTKHTRTLIFSFQSNEASEHEHITPINFHVYFVVVVLHASINECTPMIGLTRIVLSLLETSELLCCCHRLRIA
jgi:hypothetical protein